MLSPVVMSTFTVSIFRSHHTHSTVRPIATDSVATDVPRSGVLVHAVLFCDGTSRYGVPENLTTG